MSALPPSSTSVEVVETNPLFSHRSMSQPSPFVDEGMSLVDYLRLLRRWWWLAATVFVLVVGTAALWTTFQQKQYQSQASIIIRTESSAQLFPLASNESLTRIMAAENDFLNSTGFEAAAQERAGSEDPVTIEVGDVEAKISPSLITFVASSTTPEGAAETAQSWAETYVELRHQGDVAENEKSIETLESSAATLEAQREQIKAPLKPLDEQLAAAEDAATRSQLSTERLALLQTLASQLQPVEAQLGEINAELASQRLVADFLQDPNASARMNRLAEVPSSPSSPSVPQNIALGIVGGMLLAMAAVLGASSFDDKVRSTEDAEEALGIGPLTTVPYESSDRAIELPDGSPAAEAFQRLVSAIDFTKAAGYDNKTLLVTSAEKNEGKSTTAAQLGLALANEGRYVIVIGGDLRRPSLSKLFRAPAGPGVADYLTSNVPLDDCVHSVSGTPSLALLPAGNILNDRNPAELARSHELMSMVQKLRDYCDHIIIDSPPLLPVVDALELAECADGVILCSFARRSRGKALREARRILAESNAPRPLGFVLSGVKASEGYQYTYEH